LTVYNPLNFYVEFKILSTRPDSYDVIPATGHLNSQSSIDVVIKLKEDGEAVSKKHKFLVRVFNTKASVAGDQVVTVEYKRRRKNAKNVSVVT